MTAASPLGRLRGRLAEDLDRAVDKRQACSVLLRFIDDRADLLCQRNVVPSASEHLRVSADGMRLLATDLETAAVQVFGSVPEHVPAPEVSSISDDDLLAHEESDAAREASRRQLGRVVAAANERRQQRRKS